MIFASHGMTDAQDTCLQQHHGTAINYKIRHEAKTAYSQNTIKSLKHTCTL